MNEAEESAYMQGERMAYRAILQTCFINLVAGGDPEGGKAAWLLEREEIIAQLRSLCRDFGDNDWPNDARLADVIEKHLGRYLWERAERRNE